MPDLNRLTPSASIGRSLPIWTPRDVQAFLTSVRPHRLYALFHTIIALGITHEEALGLYWTDLDLHKKTLAIRRTSSTAPDGTTTLTGQTDRKKLRIVHLPTGIISSLIEHFDRQKREHQHFHGSANPNLIFTTDIGTPLRSDQVERALRALCDHAGVKALGLSELRLAHVSYVFV